MRHTYVRPAGFRIDTRSGSGNVNGRGTANVSATGSGSGTGSDYDAENATPPVRHSNGWSGVPFSTLASVAESVSAPVPAFLSGSVAASDPFSAVALASVST